MKSIFLALIGTGLFLIAAGTAVADDWRIFGAHGTVEMAPKGGSPVAIDNNKSLMMKVPVGSTLQIKGKGKVVIVSLTSRQAFEFTDNTQVAVDADTVRALSGSVTSKSGFAPPTGKAGKIGGIVMRGAGNQRSCLKTIYPVNTAILDPTPELRWENHCSGLPGVTLTILSDERVVHSAENVSGSSYRLPAKILADGNRYLWMIDGGASFDMASGVFALPAASVRDEILQRMKIAAAATTPEDRIGYIYFLSDRGFTEMAHEESRKLRAAFPEATALSELP